MVDSIQFLSMDSVPINIEVLMAIQFLNIEMQFFKNFKHFFVFMGCDLFIDHIVFLDYIERNCFLSVV